MSDVRELLKGNGKVRYVFSTNMTDDDVNKSASVIRRMVTGSLIAEYALIELKDQTKQDLKKRTNDAITSIRRVQDWFLHHPQAGAKYHKIFKQEFLSGKMILLGELIEAVWGLSEDDLEDIISQLKKHIDGTNDIEAENNTANNG